VIETPNLLFFKSTYIAIRRVKLSETNIFSYPLKGVVIDILIIYKYCYHKHSLLASKAQQYMSLARFWIVLCSEDLFSLSKSHVLHS